jgi:hypothetical protein
MSGFPSREAVHGMLRDISRYGGTVTIDQQNSLEVRYGFDPVVGVGSGYFSYDPETGSLTLTGKGIDALKSLPL